MIVPFYSVDCGVYGSALEALIPVNKKIATWQLRFSLKFATLAYSWQSFLLLASFPLIITN